MGEIRIYKLDLTVADATFDTLAGPGPSHPSYISSDWGGTDPPTTGYPEFGEMENVERKENAGASDQHVMDAVVSTDYAVSWITLCGVGNLAYGQFDCRGGGSGQPLKIRWKQYFKSSALAQDGYSVPLTLAHGSGTPNGSGNGLFPVQVFLTLEMVQTTGATFEWNVVYRTSGLTPTSNLNPDLAGHADTSDDAEHEMIVTIVPSTVTGAFPGDGTTPGSATVAADGSIDVKVDGVSVISGAALTFVINNFATVNPDVYYGKTVQHGN